MTDKAAESGEEIHVLKQDQQTITIWLLWNQGRASIKDAVKKGERQTQITVRSLQRAWLTSASYADV